jgi:CRISPR-associated exonuclease Cas4
LVGEASQIRSKYGAVAILFLAAALVLAAIILFWQAYWRRKDLGIPAGRIIYSDTHGWSTVEQPLYDAELGLVGKPDYLVETSGQIIPVEVKTSRNYGSPYDAHIFQLAAYCLLVQCQYGKRPSYGILHYPNRTYAIDYTTQLEQSIRAWLTEIHAQEKMRALPRSHQSAARCNHCSYRSVCDQRLL